VTLRQSQKFLKVSKRITKTLCCPKTFSALYGDLELSKLSSKEGDKGKDIDVPKSRNPMNQDPNAQSFGKTRFYHVGSLKPREYNSS